MLSSSTNCSVHSIVKVHGLRAFARSRPFRRPAVLSSCRPCFMLPARLSACPVRAPQCFL
nr:MAG TPA: hypothetical protein [Caudoviricetes sp.]